MLSKQRFITVEQIHNVPLNSFFFYFLREKYILEFGISILLLLIYYILMPNIEMQLFSLTKNQTKKLYVYLFEIRFLSSNMTSGVLKPKFWKHNLVLAWIPLLNYSTIMRAVKLMPWQQDATPQRCLLLMATFVLQTDFK